MWAGPEPTVTGASCTCEPEFDENNYGTVPYLNRMETVVPPCPETAADDPDGDFVHTVEIFTTLFRRFLPRYGAGSLTRQAQRRFLVDFAMMLANVVVDFRALKAARRAVTSNKRPPSYASGAPPDKVWYDLPGRQGEGAW